MRVTQGMLTSNMLRNLSQSYDRMAKYQEQLATGKRITRPSDDPVVAMKGMEYRTNLTEIDQFDRNLSEVYKWMDSSDESLDQATQVMHRLRELVVQASNGTYEGNQREAIGEEVEQLRDHLISVANTQVAGKYIFNGTDTVNPPVDANGTVVGTNTNAVNIEVSKGIEMRVNINQQNVFPQAVFDDLNDLVTDLKGGAAPGAINNYLSKIDGHVDNLLNERAELGARYNRVEMIAERVSQQKVIATRVLSDNEDVDMEKAIMNLKTQESIHRAALSSGARIMQPTLMDFLR
ncbi:flagellar hook-associated protein FlgL [Alkalihalobacillus sp. AL-G]|uniref:flagellar hook-associated protein FlgL n=1 Tax=Alkalihalobacillus sp. AL-G TaxID=2926399 RepID=UPI00272C8E78|nr:flagellar hook-associated protein FlgL [Alkalihalobacillus sp. AL-G]WLD92974.1 flagellar hook-associated protein FlgL [Alkalihalobacillus sp. AL-G]